MKLIHHSLIPTERRLITLFVGGAFLFLLIFEGFFIGSRIFFENRFSQETFMNDLARIERKGSLGHDGGRRKPPIFPGMTQLIIDLEGNILFDKNNPIISLEEIRESIDTAFFRELIPGVITPLDNLLYYKISLPDATGYKIFVAKAGYPIDDILRDILRFLILDILILLPFYFMGKYFVRETLEPVGANIEAMNDFIHDAGHELKTPLAIISGNLQVLRDSKDKDITLVNESIGTLHTMSDSLDGLLELSSLKLPDSIESTNLLSSVEHEIHELKKGIDEKDIDIEIKIDKKTSLKIDGKHLSLLLANILKNAITYNKNGGNIRISYEKGILEISDTGIGIEKKDLEKIWERFYRVDHSGKYSGNGIGLSIVYRIVKLYGGNIQVKSTPREGTTFIFRLP